MTLEGIKITEKEKVRNFIQFNRKPFTRNDVIVATGVKEKSVSEYLRNYLNEGVIAKLMFNNGSNVYKLVEKTPKGCQKRSYFTPKDDVCEDILSLCDGVSFKNLLQKTKLSETTLRRYLCHLRDQGEITWENGKYRVMK